MQPPISTTATTTWMPVPGGLTATRSPELGWIRGAGFDAVLVVGTAAVAFLTAAVLRVRPEWFAFVLLLDTWLLGFPHVVATFTRTSFDRASLARHRLLVVGLLPAILAAVFAVGLWTGQWLLATTYFYWQAFHYTRQSYGIGQAYARKAENAAHVPHALAKGILYLVPLWGILSRSHEDPGLFMGLQLYCPPVPWLVVAVAKYASLALLAVWAGHLLLQLRCGRLAIPHATYLCSHVVVFTTGYVLLDDMDIGWLAVNVWHNAQYLLFVWHANNSQFGQRLDPERRLLSRLSQRRNMPWYFVTCLTISTVVYAGLDLLSAAVAIGPVSLLFLVTMAINYHHYVVDGLIWKRPKPSAAGATPAPRAAVG